MAQTPPAVAMLSAWLAERKMTYAAFARLVRADRARIQRVVTADRGPSLALALEIERVTKGAVPVVGWKPPEHGESTRTMSPGSQRPRSVRTSRSAQQVATPARQRRAS